MFAFGNKLRVFFHSYVIVAGVTKRIKHYRYFSTYSYVISSLNEWTRIKLAQLIGGNFSIMKR